MPRVSAEEARAGRRPGTRRPAKVSTRKSAVAAPDQLFTVRLDLRTWRSLKVAAIGMRRPAAALVRDAIREYLRRIK